MKIAYLDRDGTINKEYPDDAWKDRVEPELMEGALEGMKRLQEAGFKLIIITNQYIINDGTISIAQYHTFQKNLAVYFENEGIEILKTYFCPHTEEEQCNCKKPRPGMIEMSLAQYPEIDLNASIFIGDSTTDKELAEHMGLQFYGINGIHFTDGFDSIDEVAADVLRPE